MASGHDVVIGAGEVGFHLARALSQQGRDVVVVDLDRDRRESVEEQLDVSVIAGHGAHVPVLEAAEVGSAELLLAVTSNDEVNLAASLLGKRLGAQRSIVRVGVAEDVITHRRTYEQAFAVDLLLSTQLLTTIRILDAIRGHETVAIEYLANGKVQLRKIHLGADSVLTRKPLKEVDLPRDCLVVAFFRGEELVIPGGEDRAQPGDDALILAKSEAIREVEAMVASHPEALGTVVLAGGGETAATLAQALSGLAVEVKLIERNRRRAEALASKFPEYEILHGDVTDVGLLRAERVGRASCFVAVTGQDETNLMASLLAQELGVEKVVALVEGAETVELWRRLGLLEVVSPKKLAYDRIREYIDSGFSSTIVSLERGKAEVIERQLWPASPAAGVTLAEMNPPRGLIVGAVVRGRRVFVPRGADRLEVGDTVLLFVHEEELQTVRLLFPGPESS